MSNKLDESGIQLLRQWLRLSPGREWPPPAAELLGLPPEPNAEIVEQQVLERLQWLRAYQTTYPDLVTEGMNRLAQAMLELLERIPPTRTGSSPDTAYHKASTPQDSPSSQVAANSRKTHTSSDDAAMSHHLLRPPVQPGDGPDRLLVAEKSNAFSNDAVPAAVPPPLVDPPPSEEQLPRLEVEQPAMLEILPVVPIRPARRAGLFGARPVRPRRSPERRRIFRRLVYLRRLRRLWHQLGELLHGGEHWLDTPQQVSQFVTLSHQFRLLWDHPLQPWAGDTAAQGWLTAQILRMPHALLVLRCITPTQRRKLVRDWQNGLQWLMDLSSTLRRQVLAERQIRHKSQWRTLKRLLMLPEILVAVVAVGVVIFCGLMSASR